jgi:transposase
MFVRVKESKNSPKKAVQIVQSVRNGSKVSQQIVRHVGTAYDSDELVRLKELAEHIKIKLETEVQPSIFKTEELAKMAISARIAKQEAQESINVNLKELREEQRIITGIHEIYGKLYKEIGFDKILPKSQKRSREYLYQMVMARIAKPDSKRASVLSLERDYGVKLPLDGIYSMMDLIDNEAIDKIQNYSYETAKSILKSKINVIFYDCTTLYFESFTEDELKELGYSKDMKFNQSQVVLAMLATEEGFPIGYEVFPGSQYEGHTLEVALKNIEKKYNVADVVFVADSGMFASENLKMLEANQKKYIVGARLKNLTKSLQSRITDKSNYKKLNQTEEYAEYEIDNGRRLIVTYSHKRAEKDLYDRQKAIKKLEEKAKKNKSSKSLISNYGFKKYLKVIGETTYIIDEQKIAQAAVWDGLHGIITNVKEAKVEEIVSQYRGLWQIEECFRLSKHDLRIRPIYHWTPERIKAHIAICFMALTCIRHLSYRIKVQYQSLSPELIKNELIHVQTSILKDIKTEKRYCLPSKITDNIRKIYKIMGLKISDIPYELN